VKQDKAVSLHDVMTPHGNAERTEKRRVYKAFSKNIQEPKEAFRVSSRFGEVLELSAQ
jgi:hypothetical protein